MVIVIVLSVLFYLLFVFLSGTEAVLDAMTGIDLSYIPPILAVAFIAYLIRGFRWNYYLKKMGLKVGQGEGLLLYFSGLSMLVTPMMISGAIKVGLVKARHGEPISSSFPVVIVERLTDLVGLMVIIVFCGVMLSMSGSDIQFTGVTIFVALFLICVISILRSQRICLKFIKWVGRISQRAEEVLENAYSTMYTLLTPRLVASASGIALVSWIVQGFVLHLIFQGMGIELGILETMFIYAFPTVLGIISQLPGGIGAEEGGMMALMLVSGIDAGLAAASIILFRVLTLWFGLVMGIIALKYYTSKYLSEEMLANVSGQKGKAEDFANDGGTE